MTTRVATYLEQLAQVDSIERLHELVLFARDVFEVDHTIYHSIQQSQSAFALASYEAGWAEYYESNRLFLSDPVVLNSFSRFQPYEWKTLDWSHKNARKLMVDAMDGGVGNQGYSIPIRGPNGEVALFSVNTRSSDGNWVKFLAREKDNLLLVAHYVHGAARKLLENTTTEMHRNLSPREVDTLRLLGQGQNRKRVAEKLSISEHTLRVYIESSRMKLGANNTTHAVAKAMMKGLISF